MSAWDKSYSNSYYPKVIIRLEDMSREERSFFNRLIASIGDEVDLDDLVVEQRNGDYRTVVYGSWDNDFLRYHFGSDGFWVSVRMSRDLMKEYAESPLFAAQANKKQHHWRSSVSPDEIGLIGSVIARSANFFLDSLNGNPKGTGNSAKTPKKPTKGDTKPAKKLPKTVKKDLEAAWSVSRGDKQLFKQQLEERGYTLFAAREITLAVTNAYKAAAKLKGGEVLECRREETNPYDSEAVAVFIKGGSQVGYLPKNSAKTEAFEAIGRGHEIAAIVSHRGTRAGSKRDRTHILLIEAD